MTNKLKVHSWDKYYYIYINILIKINPLLI